MIQDIWTRIILFRGFSVEWVGGNIILDHYKCAYSSILNMLTLHRRLRIRVFLNTCSNHTISVILDVFVWLVFGVILWSARTVIILYSAFPDKWISTGLMVAYEYYCADLKWYFVKKNLNIHWMLWWFSGSIKGVGVYFSVISNL